MANVDPAIDYTARDYESIRSSLLDYAAVVAPQWTTRTEGNLDMAQVELFAYGGDILQYYIDRVQMESYLPTASQRLSLIYIAQLLGYIPHGPIPSSGTVTLVTTNPGPAVTVPAGTQFTTDFITAIDAPLIYETASAVTVPANGSVLTNGVWSGPNWSSVSVVQGVTKTMVKIAVSDGTGEQSYQLPDLSVIDNTTLVYVTDASSSPVQWAYLPFLVDAQGTDYVYTVYTDANGTSWIKFGDGVDGAIPPFGMTIYATYRVGGGAITNQPANSVIAYAGDAITGVSIAQDVTTSLFVTSAMTGGADAESNDSIRTNAPLAFRAQQRAVTITDFQNMALTVPGVTKASAVANHNTSVTLYITGPGGSTPTTTLKNQVSVFFAPRIPAGTSVTVSNATLIPVNFGTSSPSNPCALFVLDRYSRTTVINQVTQALQAFLSLANVSFGQRISMSQVYAAIQGIPGVAYMVIPMMARADATQSGTADVVMRQYEIPTPGNIVINATGGVG